MLQRRGRRIFCIFSINHQRIARSLSRPASQ